jgi:hypothetical protein
MGYQKNGTPRCKCKNCGRTFQREYVNKGAKPETKQIDFFRNLKIKTKVFSPAVPEIYTLWVSKEV